MGRILRIEISTLEYLGTNISMLDLMDKTFQHFLLSNELHSYCGGVKRYDNIELFGQMVEM